MDYMKYTPEQLLRALVNETVDSVIEEEHSSVNENEITNFANDLYHQLRGLQPYTKQAEEVVNKISDSLDRYAFYPMSHLLLNEMEKIIWGKYKEDPVPYVKIVISAVDSPSMNNWADTHFGRR